MTRTSSPDTAAIPLHGVPVVVAVHVGFLPSIEMRPDDPIGMQRESGTEMLRRADLLAHLQARGWELEHLVDEDEDIGAFCRASLRAPERAALAGVMDDPAIRQMCEDFHVLVYRADAPDFALPAYPDNPWLDDFTVMPYESAAGA